jgi:hypothetical protein
MNLRTVLLASALVAATSPAVAQTPAPIPPQIASAKTAFVSNAGDADAKTLNAGYDAIYSALQTWGKYQLTATPAEADLILELQYAPVLSGCSVANGTGGCLESDTLTLHILDRVTHIALWSITVNDNAGSNPKYAARAANDILAELKSLALPNASANISAPTKIRPSDEGKK